MGACRHIRERSKHAEGAKTLKIFAGHTPDIGSMSLFCLSLTLPAHADSGSVENNYIQDIRIAAGLKAEDTGLLIFDANTAEYSDVKLYKGTSIRLQADLSQKDLWFQISVNGEPSKKAPVQLTKDKNVSLSGTDAISITGAEFGTNYFSIKIGQVDATKKPLRLMMKLSFTIHCFLPSRR